MCQNLEILSGMDSLLEFHYMINPHPPTQLYLSLAHKSFVRGLGQGFFAFGQRFFPSQTEVRSSPNHCPSPKKHSPNLCPNKKKHCPNLSPSSKNLCPKHCPKQNSSVLGFVQNKKTFVPDVA